MYPAKRTLQPKQRVLSRFDKRMIMHQKSLNPIRCSVVNATMEGCNDYDCPESDGKKQKQATQMLIETKRTTQRVLYKVEESPNVLMLVIFGIQVIHSNLFLVFS